MVFLKLKNICIQTHVYGDYPYFLNGKLLFVTAIRVIKVHNVNLTPLIGIGQNSSEVKLVSATD